MRYLTFALTKGRLANKTLDMFESPCLSEYGSGRINTTTS